MELKGKKKTFFFFKFWSIGEFLEQLYCLDFGIFSGVPSYLCFIYHTYDASSLQWVFTRLPELAGFPFHFLCNLETSFPCHGWYILLVKSDPTLV